MVRLVAVSGDREAYRLAYEIGLRAVSEQATTLKETRDRAGALSSAAAVAAGLAAALGLDSGLGGEVNLLGVIGITAAVIGFVAVTVCTAMIWRPTEGLFVQDAGVIIGSYVEGTPPAGISEVHRELALWLGRHSELNRVMLERRLTTFTYGLAALLAEVVGIVVVLGDFASG